MYISLKWVKEFTDIDLSNPIKLGQDFTLRCAEVEDVINQKELYKNIITVKIEDIEKHPDADKLLVCKVTDGKNSYTVVTGAKNINKGDIVPLAKVGSIIPENQSKIESVEFKGVKSEGMLCSGHELKYNDDSSGILILDKSTNIGKNISEVLQMDDVILEIDNKSLTNRPDLWGHYGIAREFSAIYNKTLLPLYDNKEIINIFNFPKVDNPILKNDIEINIEDTNSCPAYMVVLIENIKNTKSPIWIQKKLLSVGQRPISLLVDLSNLIMFETGEPTHAFDWNKINKSESIVIRKSKKGEEVITLDDKKRELPENTLLICKNDNTPIAIAGIMGLANSEVDENTDSILLELANFEASIIRKSSIKLGLRTEASNRFEKSLDPLLINDAAIRFLEILKKIQPEIKISKIGYVDYSDRTPKTINISEEFINKRLGTNLSRKKIISILSSLNFNVVENNEELKVIVPSFRATKDISIKEDIVEEIGRVFGYINIIPQSPFVKLNIPHKMWEPELERKIREFLVYNENFTEINTYPFSDVETEKLFGFDNKYVEIKNPPDKKKNILKRSLIPELVNKTKTNLKYFKNFKFFEIDHTFKLNNDNSIDEQREISGIVLLDNPDDAVFEARDALLNLFNHFNIVNLKIKPDSTISFLHPYKSGKIYKNNTELGFFGQIHPEIQDKVNISHPFAIFWTNVNYIKEFQKQFIPFQPISKFPKTVFDLAFVVDKNVYIQDVIEVIKNTDSELILNIKPFDIYISDKIGKNKKSVAFEIEIGSHNRTLSREEINQILESIIKNCEKKGYYLRKT